MEKNICDGCNVSWPWEHRCHRHNIVMFGEKTDKDCQCPECREADRLFGFADTDKNKEEPKE